MTEVALESSTALTLAVEAHAAVHALTGTVLDGSTEDLNIRAVVLLLMKLVNPNDLEDTSIAGDIIRQFDFFLFYWGLYATAWEVSSPPAMLFSRIVKGPENIIFLIIWPVGQLNNTPAILLLFSDFPLSGDDRSHLSIEVHPTLLGIATRCLEVIDFTFMVWWILKIIIFGVLLHTGSSLHW